MPTKYGSTSRPNTAVWRGRIQRSPDVRSRRRRFNGPTVSINPTERRDEATTSDQAVGGMTRLARETLLAIRAEQDPHHRQHLLVAASVLMRPTPSPDPGTVRA